MAPQPPTGGGPDWRGCTIDPFTGDELQYEPGVRLEAAAPIVEGLREEMEIVWRFGGPKEGTDNAEQGMSRQTTTNAFVAIVQKGKGAPIRYRLGERETGDLAQLSRWLAEAKRRADAAGSLVEGRIYANHFTPHDAIVEVLGRFQKAGIENVEFVGGDPGITRRLRWPSSDAD